MAARRFPTVLVAAVVLVGVCLGGCAGAETAGKGATPASASASPEPVAPVLQWPPDADPMRDPSRAGPPIPGGGEMILCTSAGGADYQCGASIS